MKHWTTPWIRDRGSTTKVIKNRLGKRLSSLKYAEIIMTWGKEIVWTSVSFWGWSKEVIQKVKWSLTKGRETPCLSDLSVSLRISWLRETPEMWKQLWLMRMSWAGGGGSKGVCNVNERAVLMCIKIWAEKKKQKTEMSHAVRSEEERKNPVR